MSNDINEFINNLQKLIDAQKLLDDLLGYYDIYGESFNNTEMQKMNRFIEKQGWHDSLNNRIRNYLKFDDSE